MTSHEWRNALLLLAAALVIVALISLRFGRPRTWGGVSDLATYAGFGAFFVHELGDQREGQLAATFLLLLALQLYRLVKRKGF